jgi:iron complex outermembrane receptor protein
MNFSRNKITQNFQSGHLSQTKASPTDIGHILKTYRSYALALCACASWLTLVPTASAAAQPASAAAGQPEDAVLGEIVVTARRRSESLQEVPQTVNAVTSDTLQKLNIKQFQDVQNVVPGLSLISNGTGFQASASLRGVTYDVVSTAQPTVALYFNDAPVQATFLFHSLFDIGQVEVLKGPQGTTRGVSAPSGAITVTTHKPDLSQFGGYADVTATDLQGRAAQGAINLPIIKDVLAIRFAGVIDENDFDGVRSLHSAIRPRSMTSATRTSISYEPSDAFNANVSYTHMDQRLTNFQQVSGPGAGTFTNAAGTFPASVNPPLSPFDRLAVQDAPNELKIHFDTVTGQIDSRIFGQHLSYVGSYQSQHLDSFAEGGGASAGDVGNVLPGVAVGQHVHTGYDGGYVTSHEFRIASDPAPGRFFDYTVGYFYRYQNNTGHVDNPGPFLPGAFGSPAEGVNFGAFNPAFQIPISIDIPGSISENSLFGSVTFHLGADTELSGGVRHIWSIVNSTSTLSLQNGLVALPAAGFGGDCAAASLASTYAGFCDVPIPGGTIISNLHSRASEQPNIYNVSLSHHFTRDFLVYVNTGTAYRPPTASIGIQGQLANPTDPALQTLNFHPSERSRAYEVGFKSTWLDGRARLNAALYRQRFTNLTIFIPGLVYNNVLPGQVAAGGPNEAGVYVPTNFDFTASVDALVQGFDVDAAFQITRDWSVSAQMSYSDGKVKGSQVPCNVDDAAGNPVFNTANLISLCPGGSVSRLPFWNATFQSEYNHPVTDRMDGFLRVLATYYPENKNRAEPNFTVPNYSLVNLYLGVRGHDGAWEASIFARNAFKAERALDISGAETNLTSSLATAFPGLIHPTGYYQTTMTPRREVGVNVHYAWGSR